MSGNSIGSIIGAAVGFAIGGPTGLQIGTSIGGIAGGLLMPDKIGLQDQSGTRLNNLKITSSSYGVSVNTVYGSSRVGGDVIYSSNIKEVAHYEEVEVGKGGTETYTVTTYSYAVDMAIAFCEGQAKGILKIWADSVLIYDNGITSSFLNSKYASGGITIHLGNPDQEIDWMLQSKNADTSAYRNIVYVSFSNFQLEQFGNRLPNVTAEIVINGEANVSVIYDDIVYNSTDTTQEGLFAQADFDKFVHSNYTLLDAQPHQYNCLDIYDSTVYNNQDYYVPGGGYFTQTVNWPGIGVPESSESSEFAVNYKDNKYAYYNFRTGGVAPYDDLVYVFTCDGSAYIFLDLEYYSTSNSPTSIINNDIVYSIHIPQDDTEYYVYKTKLTYFTKHTSPTDFSYITLRFEKPFFKIDGQVSSFNLYDNSIYILYANNTLKYYSNLDGTLEGEINLPIEVPNLSTTNSYLLVEESYIYIIVGFTIYCIHFSGKFKILYTPDLGTPIYYSVFHSYDNNIVKISYINNYNTGVDVSKVMELNFASISKLSTSVQLILENLSIKSGLTSNDFDYSLGSSMKITGYARSLSTARSSIEQIQFMYNFDIVEEDFKLQIKLRDSNTIATIYDNETLENVEIVKKLETELPKKVTIKYPNVKLDYMNGSQSTIRQGGNSDHNIMIELPVVMTDTESKVRTETLMYELWTSKTRLNLSVPTESFSHLNVSNVLNIIVENATYTVRIISISTSNTIMELSCVVDNKNSYISNAIGNSTSEGYTPSEVVKESITDLAVFNAPSLYNEFINSNIIYIAAKGILSENWRGCEVFKSKDNGTTYTSVSSILSPINIGRAIDILQPTSNITIWDLVSSVVIKTNLNNLYSITYGEVLNGNNYALLGNEVIQFKEAIDNGNGTFTLSKLLRGRRGTEYAVNSHTENEQFIMLTKDIVANFTTLNVERLYKGVTFNTFLDQAYVKNATYNATNRKPFTPLFNMKRAFEINSDYIIKWIRRDRHIAGYFRTLPISEDAESYTINIFSMRGLLLNSYASNKTEFNYSSSLRTNDGLVGDSNDYFYYEVYQDGYIDGYKNVDNPLGYNLDTFDSTNTTIPGYYFYKYWELDSFTGNVELFNNKLRFSGTSNGGNIGIILDSKILTNKWEIIYDYSEVLLDNDAFLYITVGSYFFGIKYSASLVNRFLQTNDKSTVINDNLKNVTFRVSGTSNSLILYYKENNDWVEFYSYSSININGEQPIFKVGAASNYGLDVSIDNLKVFI